MDRKAALALVLLMGLGGAAFAWARVQAVRRAEVPAERVILVESEPEKHKVSPAMLTAAEAHAKTPAPPFRKTDGAGETQDLGELLKVGPLVLVFIKHDCPCSVSAESYFNAIHATYRGKLRFLGVIDGDAAKAKAWGSLNGVPFPIIADPDSEIARLYGATNSAFVALIDRSGQLDELWPGYSTTMLKDLNRRAAKLAGLPEETLDAGDAPEDLYSGCPFDFVTPGR